MWATILSWLKSLAAIPGGWLARLLIDYIWKWAIDYMTKVKKDADDRKNTEATVKDDMAKADKLDENSSREDQVKAADDAFKNL